MPPSMYSHAVNSHQSTKSICSACLTYTSIRVSRPRVPRDAFAPLKRSSVCEPKSTALSPRAPHLSPRRTATAEPGTCSSDRNARCASSHRTCLITWPSRRCLTTCAQGSPRTQALMCTWAYAIKSSWFIASGDPQRNTKRIVFAVVRTAC
jgi:hypothetical protein